MTASIAVEGLTVRYGEVLALEDVSLSIPEGGVTGLIGMNGSGKSTLLKAIMGSVRPEHGRVMIHGLDPARRRRDGAVAHVPQTETVDWQFPVSVHDVVMMGRYGHLGLTRRPRAADRAAVADALERVELTGLAGRQIGQLSGGQRKRAFVARGIAQGASIMLLDEPFAGVDRRSEATISDLLRGLGADGVTVLVASHDLQALPDLATDAIVLRRRVIFHGPVASALGPQTLARAFGLDVIEGSRS